MKIQLSRKEIADAILHNNETGITGGDEMGSSSGRTAARRLARSGAEPTTQEWRSTTLRILWRLSSPTIRPNGEKKLERKESEKGRFGR